MAGSRIDMIERAAARLRRDAPPQKTIIEQSEPSQPAVAAPAPVAPPAMPRPVLAPSIAIAAEPFSPPRGLGAGLGAPPTNLVPPAAATPEPPTSRSLGMIGRLGAPRSVPAQAPPAAAEPPSAPRSLGLIGRLGAPKPVGSPAPAAVVAPPPPAAKHSRMVVLDTARLSLAGTIDWTADRTPVMEELRLIKRRLLRRAFEGSGTRTETSHLVMITSAKPREGKTFTSTNIAISISLEEDYNVLLIDADVRRQALRQNLGLEASQGFVDLLLNPDLDMADVLLRTNIPRLSVLPAGTMSDRAPELLAGNRMRDLIDDMARRYNDRIIIFDTAPCLVSSDAATLAAHVGQIVFVVEADQTQQHEIVAALNLISACPDISFILNKAQPNASTSYGGYGAY